MLEPIEELDTFQDLAKSSEMFLAYLTSPDCGVCGAIKPGIEAILEKHPQIVSVQVDTGKGEIAAQLSVFSIPAVLVYVQGKETIREARYFSVEILQEQIERYLSLLSD